MCTGQLTTTADNLGGARGGGGCRRNGPLPPPFQVPPRAVGGGGGVAYGVRAPHEAGEQLRGHRGGGGRAPHHRRRPHFPSGAPGGPLDPRRCATPPHPPPPHPPCRGAAAGSRERAFLRHKGPHLRGEGDQPSSKLGRPAFWHLPPSSGGRKALFVDLCEDFLITRSPLDRIGGGPHTSMECGREGLGCVSVSVPGSFTGSRSSVWNPLTRLTRNGQCIKCIKCANLPNSDQEDIRCQKTTAAGRSSTSSWACLFLPAFFLQEMRTESCWPSLESLEKNLFV